MIENTPFHCCCFVVGCVWAVHWRRCYVIEFCSESYLPSCVLCFGVRDGEKSRNCRSSLSAQLFNSSCRNSMFWNTTCRKGLREDNLCMIWLELYIDWYVDCGGEKMATPLSDGRICGQSLKWVGSSNKTWDSQMIMFLSVTEHLVRCSLCFSSC